MSWIIERKYSSFKSSSPQSKYEILKTELRDGEGEKIPRRFEWTSVCLIIK